MHALISNVSVASVPEPVPVIRETLLIEGPHWCGAKEQIPIQTGRCRGVRSVSDRRTQLVAQSLGHVNLADQTLLERRDRFDLERPAPVLRSYLHDAFGFALHLNHPHS